MHRQLRLEQIREEETQLAVIRDLMLHASRRGRWLTLGEIADATHFGEASISAQLRHLRKPRNGRYWVEKRQRRVWGQGAVPASSATEARMPFEYRISPAIRSEIDAGAPSSRPDAPFGGEETADAETRS